MKILLGILLIATLTACNNTLVTDTEVEAVQKVIDFYGGECLRHKGFETRNGKTETYFLLEMSQSELIESYSNVLEIPASNIAYLFYSNLKGEQNNYTHVKVKINPSSGKPYEHSFSATDLKEVEKLVQVIQNVSDKIRSKNYEGLLSEFDEEIASSLTMDQLQQFCSEADTTYGDVNATQFQGFSYFDSEEDNRALVHLLGIMIRQGKNTPISLYIDRHSKRVVTLKYEF